MKTIILAGGFGTRLSEETDTIPKPLVQIGGRPMLWHIMNQYSKYGYDDFIIALGYKGYLIKDYFLNYFNLNSNMTVDMASGNVKPWGGESKPWKIDLVDTGHNTMTGGRILRLKNLIKDTFMLTYGDGIGSIPIDELVEFHKSQKKLATVTAVRPIARFGNLRFDNDDVSIIEFSEKSQTEVGWINGGFFVLEPKVLSFISDDESSFERQPIEQLVTERELSAFKHAGFWHPMDTIRDKRHLESLWQSTNCPWK